MDKIRVIQPYRLWKRFFSTLGSVRFFGGLFLLALTIFLIVVQVEKPSGFLSYAILGLLIVVVFLFTIYNPFMRYYKPRPKFHGFDWNQFVLYFYEYYGAAAVSLGYLAGLLMWFLGFKSLSNDDWWLPPFMASVMGIIALCMYPILKPEKIRATNHEDIDYNVQVDLNDLYGVDDKLLLCYQNFKFNKEQLNPGDYLLGVSPKSIYFVTKQDKTEKFIVNFKDLAAIGSLSLFGYNLFHFESKDHIEIDLLMEQEASLAVSCAALMQKLWKALDSFIINNGEVTRGVNQSRRRVTISTENAPTIEEKEASLKGGRVIDISYSEGVISEIRNADIIESNRVIEI